MKPQLHVGLDDLRRILEDSIRLNLLLASDEDQTEIKIWGIPLLPSKGHRSTNEILQKFFQARDWKVPNAYETIYRTLILNFSGDPYDGLLSPPIDVPSGVYMEFKFDFDLASERR